MRTLLLVLISAISVFGQTQLTQPINNPSFEGPPALGLPPPQWTPGDATSTPDTQPGAFLVTTPPSQGKTYVSLVTRGPESPNGINRESIQAQLAAAFLAGKEYKYSIDLAYSKEFGYMDFALFVSYGFPVKLTIYGGGSPGDRREVLWASPLIDHSEWKTYDMIFKPVQGDVTYIILEAVYAGANPHPGNILIDNIEIDICSIAHPIETIATDKGICGHNSTTLDATSPEAAYVWSNGSTKPAIEVTQSGIYTVKVSNGCETITFEYVVTEETCACEVTAPNVFTPNDDGYNDAFTVQGSVARYSLSVFNRWGELVFESNDLANSWGGHGNGAGVYFWTIDVQCVRNESIVDSTYKGWVSLVR